MLHYKTSLILRSKLDFVLYVPQLFVLLCCIFNEEVQQEDASNTCYNFTPIGHLSMGLQCSHVEEVINSLLLHARPANVDIGVVDIRYNILCYVKSKGSL